MLYIDFLDSAQSAFPTEYYSDNQWWRPKSLNKQEEAIQIAHAAIFLRILHGETIVISHNQAFDSVSWLQAAEKIGTQSSFSFPPMIWAAYGVKQKRLTPYVFLGKAIETFENTGFKLSAWIGVDDKLRLKIAKNLKKHKSFSHMLDNMQSDIADDKTWDWLCSFANGIESFYTYLKNSRTKYGQKLLIRTAPQVQNYIWPNLQNLRDKIDGIPGKELDEVEKIIRANEEKKNKTGLLEIRSELYDAFQSSNNPNEYKKFVDLFYNEKIALSSSGGQGIFSVQDHDPLTPPKDDEEKALLADKVHSHEGLVGKTAVSIDFNPRTFPELSTLTLADCFNLLQDYEFQNSIKNLRRMWNQFPTSSIGDPLQMKRYQSWGRRTHETLMKHHNLLAQKLKGKIVIEDDAIVARTKAPFRAAVTAAAGEIFTTIAQVHLIGKVAIRFVEGFLSTWLTDTNNIPASAAGRIRKKLSNATLENYFYSTKQK